MQTTLSYLISACTVKSFQWCFLVTGTVPSTSDALGLAGKFCTEERMEFKTLVKSQSREKPFKKREWGKMRQPHSKGRGKELVLCREVWFSVQSSAGFHLGLIFLAIFYSCWCLWCAG